MANDLNELNGILFETLRGVKENNIDHKKANAVIGLSNALINNAKVQLNAYKLAGSGRAPEFFSLPEKEQKQLEVGNKDKHELMMQFAISKDYDNVAHAMGSMGKEQFMREFNTWIDS